MTHNLFSCVKLHPPQFRTTPKVSAQRTLRARVLLQLRPAHREQRSASREQRTGKRRSEEERICFHP